jgi:hypothetical protein
MDDRIAEALCTLNAFTHAGVRRFNLTRTDINRTRCDFRCARNSGAMRILFPVLIPLCWKLQQNLIIRPEKPVSGALAQLDDLDGGQLDRVRPVAFLIVETSPGNHQAWVAIWGGDGDLVKRFMKGVGADPRVSCSGRVPGSPNVKPKYAPDFPMVRIVEVRSGRTTTPRELESLGLLAESVAARAFSKSAGASDIQVRNSGNGSPRGWPDYDYCLQHAWLKKDGTRDRSAADSLWCKFARQRNHEMHSIKAKLPDVSEKARQECERGNQQYVERTVDDVFEAAEKSENSDD